MRTDEQELKNYWKENRNWETGENSSYGGWQVGNIIWGCHNPQKRKKVERF